MLGDLHLALPGLPGEMRHTERKRRPLTPAGQVREDGVAVLPMGKSIAAWKSIQKYANELPHQQVLAVIEVRRKDRAKKRPR